MGEGAEELFFGNGELPLYAVRGRRSIVMHGMFLGVFLCIESKSVETFCGTLLQIPTFSAYRKRYT